MKKVILLGILLFSVSQFTFSQDFDQRLLARYSKTEIKKIMKTNPAEYDFLVKSLDKGSFISEIPAEKEKSIQFNGEIDAVPSEATNYLSLGKKVTDEFQYYRFKNSTKMLVIMPRISIEQIK